jgi:hypothetical protein
MTQLEFFKFLVNFSDLSLNAHPSKEGSLDSAKRGGRFHTIMQENGISLLWLGWFLNWYAVHNLFNGPNFAVNSYLPVLPISPLKIPLSNSILIHDLTIILSSQPFIVFVSIGCSYFSEQSRKSYLRSKPQSHSNSKEGGIIKGCKWKKVEESDTNTQNRIEELKCKRNLESFPYERYHTRSGMIYSRRLISRSPYIYVLYDMLH